MSEMEELSLPCPAHVDKCAGGPVIRNLRPQVSELHSKSADGDGRCLRNEVRGRIFEVFRTANDLAETLTDPAPDRCQPARFLASQDLREVEAPVTKNAYKQRRPEDRVTKTLSDPARRNVRLASPATYATLALIESRLADPEATALG